MTSLLQSSSITTVLFRHASSLPLGVPSMQEDSIIRPVFHLRLSIP